LKKGIGDDVVEITVTYKSDAPLGMFKRCHKSVCPIDIKSFAGTDVSDKNWDKKTAEQLEKIARTLKRGTSLNNQITTPRRIKLFNYSRMSPKITTRPFTQMGRVVRFEVFTKFCV
jgi:hypothetical protein